MDLLDSEVHTDAWGSATAIPELLGDEPDGTPYSELWMGAHPASPSRLRRAGRTATLAEVIAADPEHELGADVLAAYGPRLPFLLKVLAAERPLSLQAHPSLEQAAAGFAEEERRGIAIDDPTRNYADANHKPEMLCALTEFDAACGFRPVAEAVAMLTALDVPELAADRETLRDHPNADGLRAVLDRLLHVPSAQRAPLVEAVAAGCARLAAGNGRDARLAQTVVELAARYPTDVGLVCTLFMNRLTLQPGEAVFLAAGNLHAYLRGVGVEIMASSDNVLRAGLTGRRVDVDELLRVLDTTSGPPPLVTPQAVDEIETVYPVPVPDFALSRLTLRADRPYELPTGRPQILLVVAGTVAVTQRGLTRELIRGQAGFFPAGDPPAALAGPATAFLASPGPTRGGEPAHRGAAG